MKKVLTKIMILIIVIIIGCMFFTNNVFATVTATNTDSETKLIELKNSTATSIEEYTQEYGSQAYGITAYILHLLRIFSIPFCFLGIVVSAIHQYIIGIRKLDTQEKGLAMMVTFVTLAIICQILPLVFTIVVKFGRE